MKTNSGSKIDSAPKDPVTGPVVNFKSVDVQSSVSASESRADCTSEFNMDTSVSENGISFRSKPKGRWRFDLTRSKPGDDITVKTQNWHPIRMYGDSSRYPWKLFDSCEIAFDRLIYKEINLPTGTQIVKDHYQNQYRLEKYETKSEISSKLVTH